MNAKLLTDDALREDIYIELMYMAGSLGYYRMHPEQLDGDAIRRMVNEQADVLMPVVKRHIKRHVKVTKEATDLSSEHNTKAQASPNLTKRKEV